MKQIKLFGVIALALTLGLAACSGKPKPCDKHDWGEYSVTKAATCTEDGEETRTCKVCGEAQTKVIKAKHTWGDYVVKTPATCTVKGEQERECSVCHVKETKEIPLADHTYGEWEVTAAADCENAGSRKRVCSVCEHEDVEEIPATGHTYPKDDAGEDLVNWQKEPTCEEAGTGSKTCSVCNHVETVTAAKLGHDIQLVGEETEPDEGKAAVRVYKCSRCDVTYLGFKANEVSEESKKHLTFTESTKADGTKEVGASFWGRPIGNAIALDANGTSVAQQVDETVYCSTETGDFFEYVFDLTQKQVDEAGLDNCRLWLDAKPADYMNGGDFFAYVGGNTDDWTPGFYIDGADEHIEKDADGKPVMVKDHAKLESKVDVSVAGAELETEVPMGKRITDYRYILYVDGKVQQFEANVSNPTHGNNTNMTREEFCLPFVFNLHAGENRISLRMAGGYRSTFFNFTFRPIVEDAGGEGGDTVDYTQVLERAWDANPTAKTNGDGKEYFQLTDSTNSKVGVKISIKNYTVENDATAGTELAADGKINAGNDHNAILTYKVTAPKAGAYQMVMRAKSSSSGLSKTLDDRYFTVTLNGVAVDIQGTRVALTGDTADFVAAPTINLTGNEDTIKITAPDYRPVFDVDSFIIFAEH